MISDWLHIDELRGRLYDLCIIKEWLRKALNLERGPWNLICDWSYWETLYTSFIRGREKSMFQSMPLQRHTHKIWIFTLRKSLDSVVISMREESQYTIIELAIKHLQNIIVNFSMFVLRLWFHCNVGHLYSGSGRGFFILLDECFVPWPDFIYICLSYWIVFQPHPCINLHVCFEL